MQQTVFKYLTREQLEACLELSKKRREACLQGIKKSLRTRREHAVATQARNEQIKREFMEILPDKPVRGEVRDVIKRLGRKYALGVKSIERIIYN